MLKVVFLSLILLALGFAGMAVKLIFNRKAKFSGGNCAATTPELEEKGIGCGCGGSCAANN